MRHTEEIVFKGLIGVLLFAALAHGAVEAWSLLLVEIVLVLLFLIWGGNAIISNRLMLTVPHTIYPLIGLWLISLIQSISVVDVNGYRQSLSLDVEATRQVALALTLLLGAMILITSVIVKPKRLLQLVRTLIIFGLVLALFGLIQHFAWDGHFYWWRATTNLVTSPFGPFVAHNHFAGYLELIIPFPIAFILVRSGRIEMRILYGFAAMLMIVAALTSLSRGGFISLAVELLFLFAMLPLLARRTARNLSTKKGARRSLKNLATMITMLTVLVVAIITSIFWIGLEPIITRMTKGQLIAVSPNEESFFMSRGWIWRDSLGMFQAHPWTGVGLGAFETVYPKYSQSEGTLIVAQAHNDYLQLAAEVGVVGPCLAVWFIVLVLRQMMRGLRYGSPLTAGLSLACGTAVLGIAVHSLFDFNLQLISHSLLLVFISGVLAHVSVPQLIDVSHSPKSQAVVTDYPLIASVEPSSHGKLL